MSVKTKKLKDSFLYGWLFTYNPYSEKWVAYKRGTNYFAIPGTEANGVYANKNMNALINHLKTL